MALKTKQQLKAEAQKELEEEQKRLEEAEKKKKAAEKKEADAAKQTAQNKENDLVGAKDNGEILCTSKNACDLFVQVGNTILDVYNEEDKVSFFCCQLYLLTNFFFKNIVAIDNPTAGVND